MIAALGAALGALHPAGWSLTAGALAGRRGRGRTSGRARAARGRRCWPAGWPQRSLDGLDGVRGGPGRGRGHARERSRRRPSGVCGSMCASTGAGWRRGRTAHRRGRSTDRLAGEVVRVRGERRPGRRRRAVAPSPPRQRSPHGAGRRRRRVPGDPVARLANGLRRTLVAGTASLDPRQRSLFTGLVLGDDRAPAGRPRGCLPGRRPHPPAGRLGAERGLRPGAGRSRCSAACGCGRGWLATLAVIGLFGVMTRFEPSVLRASAMAALAATLAMAGSSRWPGSASSRSRSRACSSSTRCSCGSVGFQLSVCAADGHRRAWLRRWPRPSRDRPGSASALGRHRGGAARGGARPARHVRPDPGRLVAGQPPGRAGGRAS